MLRCKPWSGQSNTFVCLFCRRQTQPLTPRSSLNSSPIYSASFRRNYSDDSGATGGPAGSSSPQNATRPVPRGPLGGGWGQSNWGSATGPAVNGNGNSSSNESSSNPVDDGLLPHERAARQRLNVAQPPKPPPAQANVHKTHHQKVREYRKEGLHHKGHDQKDHESKAPLVRTGHQYPKHQKLGLSDIGHARPHQRPNHGRRGMPENGSKVDRQTTPEGRGGIGEGSGGWGLLKRKNIPTPVEEHTQKASSRKTGGGDAFWQRFKSHVDNEGKAQNQKGSGPGMTADQAAMWDSLEETTKTPGWQQPGRSAPRPVAEDQPAEEKPRRRESSRYDDSYEIERDARKRGKGARPYDDKKPKKGLSGRKPSRARNDDDDGAWDEEAERRAEERRERKAERKAQRQLEAMEAQGETGPPKIFLPEFINLFNLAGGLKMKSERLLYSLEEMGFENITEDSIFTGETAALIAMEFGFEPTVDTGSERDILPQPELEDPSVLPQRPPVVTIMGHVDHGKTTLLDYLRKSSVAAQEHGGITQHIGAFVVNMSSGKRVTFLDTPGHAAFLTMRQRGANVTDIVVLVVAADDSVKPQTIEAIKHAHAARVPMIVAINKMDKDDARPDQVKSDLARHGVDIEDFGGDVQVVLVSGKTGLGMEDLEENITTLSEILDVRAEEDNLAEGWVLEASVKLIGKSASVLVKRGTLRVGDCIVAGTAWARVRVLRNEAGVELTEAPPGTPVEVIGWRDELPQSGDQMLQAPDEDRARTAIDYREEMRYREESSKQLVEQEQREREKREAEEAAAAAEGGEEAVADSEAAAAEEAGTKLVNFTVKADVVGSVEAVSATIQELGNHEVRARILRSSAGQISEFDVEHAATSGSVIVNFNSTVPAHIKRMADLQGVRVLDHTVIYHLHDEIKQTLSDYLPENVTHKVVGEAEILQVFPINVRGRVYHNIAGCRIRNGLVNRNLEVRILRDGRKVFEGKINALKHGKKDVPEMRKGTECGISFEDYQDFAVGDQVQAYEVVREKRSL